MEIIRDEPITLYTDTLDVGLIQFLEARYMVIVQQEKEKIKIELQNK